MKKYFLCILALFHITLQGNEFIQYITNIPHNCMSFSRYAKNNPLFGMSLLAAICGTGISFAKIISCSNERSKLEEGNIALHQVVIAAEERRAQKQREWGPNWNVTIDYEHLYKTSLDPKSDLCQKLVSLCNTEKRLANIGLFSLFATGLLIGMGRENMSQ